MMLKTMIRKLIFIFIVFILLISISGCTANCPHCFNDNKDFPSLLVSNNQINNQNSKINSKKVIMDFFDKQNSFESYFNLHTNLKYDDYFCNSLFYFNYVIAVWVKQYVATEYYFKSLEINDSVITFYIGTDGSYPTVLSSNVYFIVIPKSEFPAKYNHETEYDVVFKGYNLR